MTDFASRSLNVSTGLFVRVIVDWFGEGYNKHTVGGNSSSGETCRNKSSKQCELHDEEKLERKKASHIATRTATYPTDPTHLWCILTSVQDYPTWQAKIVAVTHIKRHEDQVDFIEHHHHQRRRRLVEQNKPFKLLRIMDDREISGSWTYELTPIADRQTALKITQQGVIRRPLVRVAFMLLFGLHRRMDRFLRDLDVKVKLDLSQSTQVNEKIPDQEQQQAFSEKTELAEESQPGISQMTAATTAEKHDDDGETMAQSAYNKDWDLLSEIYQRVEKPVS
ncbi:hypothetical protein BCR43DRAFT_559835 [Syncephalastrum racemosum]|uniref:Uncharacterized protein n=1 Tax=Syncephalastrum racemosum TaxID=13706 RepID=A0A1X2HU06_SYNRA|nr:hypothetical protein BCR43DRAFT_559835 [Syncephalastrum racemosum]